MNAQLENVLDAYAAADPGPSRSTLAAWIGEYPQFARELTEFTARWQLLEWADAALPADAGAVDDVVADDDRLLLRGISAAQSAFYAARAKQQALPAETRGVTEAERVVGATPSPVMADAPITSFATAARRAGLSHDELIDRAGLSDGLFRKLDRRLIDPITIPARVLSDLASAIGRDVETVAAYTRLAPTFGAGAQHRSDRAPTLPSRREDFFEAVRTDLAIEESRRQALLSLPRPDAEDGARGRAGGAGPE